MNEPERDSEKSAMRAAGPYLTLGMQLALAVVLFLLIGHWLDGKFGTSPWFTIGGAFIGCAGGLIQFVRTVITLTRQNDEHVGKKN